MIIKKIPISRIKEAAYNPRLDLKPGDPEYEKIKRSIEEFDLVEPLVWNETTGNLVGGHQRLKVLKERGDLEVDVSIVNISDLNKEKALNVTLNKIQGDWDNDKLKLILNEIRIDFDLINLGFSADELFKDFKIGAEGLTEDDEAPELQKETKIKTGDIFKLGNHVLMCGNSIKFEDIKRLMENEKADIAILDPPYGVSYFDKNKFLNQADKGNRIQKEMAGDNQDEKDIQKFWFKSFEIVRDNLAEINSYYVFGPQRMMIIMMMMKAKLPYRNVIIWVKNNHVLGRCDYHYRHEPLLFGWTKTHKFYGNGEFRTSVWEVDKPHKSDLHPTMKPVALMVNALLNSSQSGQICLDPFGGSGSTLIACEKTGRKCRMMEIEPIYCDVIIQRWENFTGQKAVKI